MIIPRFYGQANNGKLSLYNKERYDEYLRTLNGDIELVISKKGRLRSVKQNAWYFGVAIKLIAEYLGYTSEIERQKLHEFLKKQCGFKETIGIKDKDGKEIIEEIVVSTSRLLTTEFNEYKDNIQRWAAENLDLYIPDPNEIILKTKS